MFGTLLSLGMAQHIKEGKTVESTLEALPVVRRVPTLSVIKVEPWYLCHHQSEGREEDRTVHGGRPRAVQAALRDVELANDFPGLWSLHRTTSMCLPSLSECRNNLPATSAPLQSDPPDKATRIPRGEELTIDGEEHSICRLEGGNVPLLEEKDIGHWIPDPASVQKETKVLHFSLELIRKGYMWGRGGVDVWQLRRPPEEQIWW
ncbi:hypothetical protein B0F90DRAFT_1669916 [Multifurca ochricompacta]|uniref:Uncharacterized protein n=1 Tax=Multifurca ochricompacta TaxID=376703 RepID=A0AAD4M0U6_9AGAM|nr:hypothetical protein B0F90DRAFT_1669916 [Multifurca ochricompacta]